MEEKLNNHFVIYIKKQDDELTGTGIKCLENGKGMDLTELDQKQLKILQELTNIKRKLENGNMLQIYRDGPAFIAEIGKTIKEGPYGENDSFEVIGSSKDSCLAITLINLDDNLLKQSKTNTHVLVKKTYRLYGEDKYTEKTK